MGLGLVLGEFQTQQRWMPDAMGNERLVAVGPGPEQKDPGRDGFSEAWGRRMHRR